MKLNPNHEVTQALDDEMMHKVTAILVLKMGGRATITPQDIEDLNLMFPGQMPTLVSEFNHDSIEFWLVPEKEGRRLAAEEGGLPQ
jgi:hypothetical protein